MDCVGILKWFLDREIVIRMVDTEEVSDVLRL